VNRKTESQTEMQGRFVGEPDEPDTADLEIPMLTTAEVAKTLQVSQPTVRRLIKREGLPAIKLQRRYRIPRGLFEDWVKERAVGVQEGDA
jgi:excisionase family DNA binding protein